MDEIRKALEEIDGMRAEKGLSPEEREEMEMAAVALRNAEREWIERTTDGINDRLKKATDALKERSSAIREKTSRLNSPSRVMARIKDILDKIIELIRL